MTLDDAAETLRAEDLVVARHHDGVLEVAAHFSLFSSDKIGNGFFRCTIAAAGKEWMVWGGRSCRQVELFSSLSAAVSRAMWYCRGCTGQFESTPHLTRPLTVNDYVRWKKRLVGVTVAQQPEIRENPVRYARLMYSLALRHNEWAASTLMMLVRSPRCPRSIKAAAEGRLRELGHHFQVEEKVPTVLRLARCLDSQEAWQAHCKTTTRERAFQKAVGALHDFVAAIEDIEPADRTDDMTYLAEVAVALSTELAACGTGALSSSVMMAAKRLGSMERIDGGRTERSADDTFDAPSPPVRPARVLAVGGGGTDAFHPSSGQSLRGALLALLEDGNVEGAATIVVDRRCRVLVCKGIASSEQMRVVPLSESALAELAAGAAVVGGTADGSRALFQLVEQRLLLAIFCRGAAAADLRRRAWPIATRMARILKIAAVPTFTEKDLRGALTPRGGGSVFVV